MSRWPDSALRWVFGALLACLAATSAMAQDGLVVLSSRGDVGISYWWMPRDGAVATVLLFAGGHGGIGLKGGVPQSGNFLIRSRDDFARAGFNVALVGNPNDARQMTPAFRRSGEHQADVRTILDDIGQRSNVPVWLVGTSQGTLSAAANSVALGARIAGVVLSSTVTGSQPGGSVVDIALEDITVPVLIFQHKHDACRITPPAAAQRLISRLVSAPVKQYIEVDGGTEPSSGPCEAFHHHGYVGMEAQAVDQISGWIKHPSH
ncbi:alpha/beta hydrolase [Rhodoferax sp. BLA1]|uniref:alpha/beta hydrolase n=1 Tax=Rhodoferax sp. BLA1 TaxID=2576062 RepID=UPI0015D30FFC|nr:alpha/beta hydrolase [Rhodoferax sp. BLA1]